MNKKAKVITMCGSLKFKKEFIEQTEKGKSLIFSFYLFSVLVFFFIFNNFHVF